MHMAVLTLWLVAGASPSAVAAPLNVTQDEVDVVVEQGAIDPGPTRPGLASPPRLLPGRWVPNARADYAPGALSNPTGSWYKHSYLAFRGNYYLDGYDYRREFNYPWRLPKYPPARYVANRSVPSSHNELVPTPAAEERKPRPLSDLDPPVAPWPQSSR